MQTIYVPNTSALFEFQGVEVNWIEGRTTIEEGAPILRGRMHMVRPMVINHPAPEPAAKKPARDQVTA